jgi:membrane fusion protein, adhesin transport system
VLESFKTKIVNLTEGLRKIFRPYTEKTEAKISKITSRYDFNKSRKLLWISCSCILIFIIWASFGKLEQITRATGQVIASSRTQVIQSLDGGLIETLEVREGDDVVAGQLLVKFVANRSDAAWRETNAKAAALSAVIARLQAEISGGPLEFNSLVKQYPGFVTDETNLYIRRQRSFKDEILALSQTLSYATEELNAIEPLYKSGDVGLSEVIRLRRQVSELKGQIANRRNKYFQDSQAELAKNQEDLASVVQVLEQRRIQLDNLSIFAPMAGTVKNIKFTTVGGVVKPSESIMEIVPEDNDLLVEVKVRPADIGFIRPKLPATIKIDAFDYAVFGALQGEVVYISADTIKEEGKPADISAFYVVRVRSNSTYLKGRSNEMMDITPGMTATVEIVTGKKSIMSYITKPITKTFNESMGER